MKVKLKAFQDKFVFSPKRYPAFVGGWATGKSMCLILRAMLYSEHIPNNLGVIFRKEFSDLKDSTLKDFEAYTGLKVNSRREAVLPNKSTIMFRHIEELNNIQNINLGWFAIEQAEELDTDKEFFMLFGRLRRKVEPSEGFKQLGLAERSGFVIGNTAGDNWVKKLWKELKLEDSDLSLATTYDNQDVLPEDFIKSLEQVKRNNPAMYEAYVMNSFDVEADRFILIPSHELEALKRVIQPIHGCKRIISCDPSLGGDECVIYVMKDNGVIEEKIMHERNTMIIAGEILALSRKHKINDIAIDSIGIGKGIADRLSEWKLSVQEINSAERAEQPELFNNRRTEMWFYLSQEVIKRNIPYMIDDELKKQLSTVRYKVLDSNGKIKLESKDDIRQRLGRSPDKGDCFCYGIWGLRNIKDSNPYQSIPLNFERAFAGGRAGY